MEFERKWLKTLGVCIALNVLTIGVHYVAVPMMFVTLSVFLCGLDYGMRKTKKAK